MVPETGLRGRRGQHEEEWLRHSRPSLGSDTSLKQASQEGGILASRGGGFCHQPYSYYPAPDTGISPAALLLTLPQALALPQM